MFLAARFDRVLFPRRSDLQLDLLLIWDGVVKTGRRRAISLGFFCLGVLI